MKAAAKASLFTITAMRYYVLLAGIYLALIFILPPNPAALAAYNITALEYKVVMLGLALPSLAVWLVAFIGYVRLHQYARVIQHTPEAALFKRLATGCAWLAWSLPIMTIGPALLSAMVIHWPGFRGGAIIITNYISLAVALIAFSFIAHASRALLIRKDRQGIHPLNARLITIVFLILGVAYCYLTFRRFDLASLTATNNPYFLPIWVTVLTVTVPFLYAWFTGLLAAYEILLYSRLEQGLLYRQSLTLMSGGLLAVVISLVASQYISSVMPRLDYLVIDYSLVLTLIFRIIGGGGFLLLAVGASRLRKIEEI